MVALVSCVDNSPGAMEACRLYCADFASCAAVLRAASARSYAERDCDEEAIEQVAGSGAAGASLARELLGSSSPVARALGARVAAIVPPDEYDGVAPALAEAYRAHPDPDVVQFMGQVHDSRVVAALQLELSNAADMALSAPIAGLEAMGPIAKPALPALRELAASHWDRRVRMSAARAYGALAGESLEAAPDRCPVAVQREPSDGSPSAAWSVALHDAAVKLSDFDTATQESDGCPNLESGPPSRRRYATRVGDECLVSRSGFECNDRLDVWQGATKAQLGHALAGPLVPRDHDVVQFGSCCHMGFCHWSVGSVARAPDGRWGAQALAHSVGKIVAFGTEGTSLDLLVVSGNASECPGSRLLLQIDAEERVTVRK